MNNCVHLQTDYNQFIMESPFVFGKVAVDEYFIDRRDEIESLKANFIFGTNTILISPRRWGKSSLVSMATKEVLEKEKSIKIVHLDMFNVRTEEEFYKALSEKVLSAVSSKFDELVSNTKKFMKQWAPKISISPEAQQEFSFGLDWEEVKKQADEILDLAETIAIEKNIKLIICIDEFQNLSFFDDPLAFQKKARSHWQQHQSTSYCLYGSKRHMLLDVFTSPSMPFYKFGSLMFLQKIPSVYWKVYIQKRFSLSGKKITKRQSGNIADLVQNHPYYVQQLAQLCWLMTKNKVEDKVIALAIESLVLQLSLLFQSMTETLSTGQIHYLKAVLNNESRLSSKKVIDTYKLGSSANVARIKKALISKEIIDDQQQGGTIELLDPVFSIWLKTHYFR